MDKRPILLVEDNADDELLTLRAFKKNNIPNPVIVARDGQEAVDYLFNPDNALPGFILLDLKLPKISGIDVLRRVRMDKRTQFVPVIMLTSSSLWEDLRDCYSLGVNSYIQKTINLDVFTVLIGDCANYWLKCNVSPLTGGDQPR